MGVKKVVLGLMVTCSLLRAEPMTFESGEKKVGLLELYTSEGCSSCPPAEAWLGELKTKPGLWKDFVPVAFHVDYWNSLGWPDRYASAEFTRRQRDYAAAWRSDSVYTPEFVLNGQEWRPAGNTAPGLLEGNPGKLQVTVPNDAEVQVAYFPSAEVTEPLTVTVAPLGMGIHTRVLRGENAGHDLSHDFVALSLASAPLKRRPDGSFAATLKIPSSPAAEARGLAVWVSSDRSAPPIQAVGGLFSTEK